MRNRYIKVIFILLLVLIATYFGVRKYVLNEVLQRLTIKTETNFSLKIGYSQAGFVGFKTILIRNLTVLSQGNDTIVRADSVQVTPKLIQLLFGKMRISELSISHANVYFNVHLLRLFKNRYQTSPKDSASQPKEASYARMLNSIQRQLFTVIPKEITIRNTGLVYRRDSIFASIYCEHFSYGKRQFSGELILADNSLKEKCLVKGFLDLGDHTITANICHSDTTLIKLPYVGPRWQAMLGFDTLQFSAHFEDVDTNLLDIKGTVSAKHLTLQHKRIGPDPVITNTGQVNFTLHAGNKFIELDSSSVVRINRFSFSPYGRFESGTSKKFACAFIYKEFDARELFESMPEGLFSNFAGIETEGKLAYQMHAAVDFGLPDSVQFESKLENKGFKIKKYGVSDFRIMNGAFVQEVYDNDRFVKSILVGPNNPDFISLEQISSYLRSSVLTAEDGDFFYHKGFNERAFRESIATNLKESRFARGGSTISMQLVKNVFLSRKKTISRKVEEALIVWMIENLHLTPKQRMFEVYLNIIEWGPGIYGIKPAARFYFNKTPEALSLSESIYLSSLVPRPKAFRYAFISNGVLRDYFGSYFRLLSNIMLRRNQITPADTFNLAPNITLTGEAKKYLTSPDTVAREDSLFFVEPKQLPRFKID